MAHAGGDISSRYRGAEGLDPKFIKELEKQYGFDKPAPERFWMLVRDYATFNLGESYYRDAPVVELIKEKLPVSMSLGLWMTLISYAISIPLGVRKAVKDGSRFDTWTSALVIFGYAIPSFLFAILLVVLFCGGSFWQIFPLRGLTSDNFADFSWPHKILDYLWHITLPVASLVLGSFATTTLLTKNSFLDEIKKAYVQTARMKGLSERRVLYGHVFRNAMLIVIAGFPGAFISAFFTGSLLIEQVFSLDGLGYLSYDSLIQRDYPVVLGTLYVYRAARHGREPHLRPHLHLGRSAHRLRDARGVMRTRRHASSRAPSPLAGEGVAPQGRRMRGRAARRVLLIQQLEGRSPRSRRPRTSAPDGATPHPADFVDHLPPQGGKEPTA